MHTNPDNNLTNMLPTDKNLRATVPAALLARIEQAAASERLTLVEFVTEVIERGLKCSGLDDVFAYGKRHARERGLKPSDVEKAIVETRGRETEHRR